MKNIVAVQWGQVALQTKVDQPSREMNATRIVGQTNGDDIRRFHTMVENLTGAMNNLNTHPPPAGASSVPGATWPSPPDRASASAHFETGTLRLSEESASSSAELEHRRNKLVNFP